MATPQISIPQAQLAEFCQRYQIRQLSLFGSVLRDDFRADSDVDVLVEFAPEAHIGLLALLGAQEELSALFQRPVDLVPRNGLKAVIRDEVLASSQVVYAV